jgi:hypothetical protein
MVVENHYTRMELKYGCYDDDAPPFGGAVNRFFSANGPKGRIAVYGG